MLLRVVGISVILLLSMHMLFLVHIVFFCVINLIDCLSIYQHHPLPFSFDRYCILEVNAQTFNNNNDNEIKIKIAFLKFTTRSSKQATSIFLYYYNIETRSASRKCAFSVLEYNFMIIFKVRTTSDCPYI